MNETDVRNEETGRKKENWIGELVEENIDKREETKRKTWNKLERRRERDNDS